jgi:hypothetical protein
MTVGKAAALTGGFVGAVALGVAIGPSITDRLSDRDAHMTKPAAVAEQSPAASASPARTSAPRARVNAPRAEARPNAAAIPASEPKLYERLKPVLNRGTRMEIAADGFASAEQFATVAHAARNTEVPFMVLKHRVLTEKRSLADAIQLSKPDADAKAEVARARNAAKADIEALAG